jgi:hypothetical protein
MVSGIYDVSGVYNGPAGAGLESTWYELLVIAHYGTGAGSNYNM